MSNSGLLIVHHPSYYGRDDGVSRGVGLRTFEIYKTMYCFPLIPPSTLIQTINRLEFYFFKGLNSPIRVLLMFTGIFTSIPVLFSQSPSTPLDTFSSLTPVRPSVVNR